jgi:hypothetical protein
MPTGMAARRTERLPEFELAVDDVLGPPEDEPDSVDEA